MLLRDPYEGSSSILHTFKGKLSETEIDLWIQQKYKPLTEIPDEIVPESLRTDHLYIEVRYSILENIKK
jgi:hypothetical protein